MPDGHEFQLDENLAPKRQIGLESDQALDTAISEDHVLSNDANAHPSPQATETLS
jgi:hypothetical protein